MDRIYSNTCKIYSSKGAEGVFFLVQSYAEGLE